MYLIDCDRSIKSFIMVFSLNRVILACLAEIDLFAVLALADTSSTIHQFIHNQILTTSLLCRFLREHQYVLHHDARYCRLIPHQHVVWLCRAFEKLCERDTETANYLCKHSSILYPLFGLIPFEAFKNTNAALLHDFHIPEHEWNGEPVYGDYTLEQARTDYFVRLCTSWLHEPRHLIEDGDTLRGFYDFHESYAEIYLRKDFLFCKKYIDDFNTCYRILYSEGRYQRRRSCPPMLVKIDKMREAFRAKNLNLLLQKRCLQAAVEYWYLYPNPSRTQATSAEDFKSLMKSEGWLEMWDKPELAWWYSLGLWQYGHDCVRSFIEQSFPDKCQALVWLFLGAHRWFITKSHRWQETDYLHLVRCCSGEDYGGEREYLINLVKSLSWEDRIWTMRQIVRKAPEYGVCRNLGANIFNYFVVHSLDNVDTMMCVLLEEIIGSPLQYLFEYAIDVAISEYHNIEQTPLMFREACRFGSKLLRKNLGLYTILSS